MNFDQERLDRCQAAGWEAYSRALRQGKKTCEAVAAYQDAFTAEVAETAKQAVLA